MTADDMGTWRGCRMIFFPFKSGGDNGYVGLEGRGQPRREPSDEYDTVK